MNTYQSLCLEVQSWPGSSIEDFAKDLHELADSFSMRVSSKFNAIAVAVAPNTDYRRTVKYLESTLFPKTYQQQGLNDGK